MVSSMRDADDVKSACIALVTERSCLPALLWCSCSVASCRAWFFHAWWHLVVLASADSWDARWHTIHACSPKTNKPISSTAHPAATKLRGALCSAYDAALWSKPAGVRVSDKANMQAGQKNYRGPDRAAQQTRSAGERRWYDLPSPEEFQAWGLPSVVP